MSELILTHPTVVTGREDHLCTCGMTIPRKPGRGAPRKRCDTCAKEARKLARKAQRRTRAAKAMEMRRAMAQTSNDTLPTTDAELRPIPGHGGYLAGSDGHIYSNKGWRGIALRRMSEGLNQDSYATVQLSRGEGCGGRTRTTVVHKLVAAAFLPPKPKGAHDLRHLDGNHRNNAPVNLAWGTQKDNANDRARHGRTARGERNAGAKLSEAQVKEIKRRLAAGERQVSLQRIFNVPQSTMSEIARGKLWGWLKVAS